MCSSPRSCFQVEYTSSPCIESCFSSSDSNSSTSTSCVRHSAGGTGRPHVGEFREFPSLVFPFLLLPILRSSPSFLSASQQRHTRGNPGSSRSPRSIYRASPRPTVRFCRNSRSGGLQSFPRVACGSAVPRKLPTFLTTPTSYSGGILSFRCSL